jgi:putative sporulation protein YyaC
MINYPKNPIYVCVGTDRSTVDALGPLVGSQLQKLGYEVYGTINRPCQAMNLQEVIDGLPKDRIIIAVDACLGSAANVSTWKISEGSLKPGAGVGKDLPPVGDFHITGIVNVGGFMEYFVLQNTRLSLVMKMADEIVDFIKDNHKLMLSDFIERERGKNVLDYANCQTR